MDGDRPIEITLLAAQLDSSMEFCFQRLDGLTDEEYFWRPAPGAWTIVPRGTQSTARSEGAGDFVSEFDSPPPEPPPMRSIAWLLWHMSSICAARDWAAFGELLAPDVVYELPQTRERIRGRDTYLRFNVEYPGDWSLAVERVVGQGRLGASWVLFTVAGRSQSAASFFDLDEHGRISRITEFWPEPYEPPPGREHLVERF